MSTFGKRTLALVLSLVLLLGIVLPVAVSAEGESLPEFTAPAGYSANDYDKLADFALYGQNLTALGWISGDPEGWTGITWNDANPARVIGIDLPAADLAAPLTGMLDVSGLDALTSLNVNGNRLSALNAGGCTALSALDCANNTLVRLSLSSNLPLASLDCSGNYLDLSDGTALRQMLNALHPAQLSDSQNVLVPDGDTTVDKRSLTISAVPNADVYYTLDGTTPTTASNKVAANTVGAEHTLNASCALHLAAQLPDGTFAPVITRTYTIQTPAPILPANNSNAVLQQSITLTPAENTKLYYTLNNSAPGVGNGVEISAPATFSITADTVVRAIAVRPGCLTSAEAVQSYTVITEKTPAPIMPEYVPLGDAYFIYIDALPDTKVFYTVDGSEPDLNGSQYIQNGTRPIEFSASATVKLIAWKDGYAPSDMVSKKYTVRSVTPALPPTDTKHKIYDQALLAPKDATLYYTTDGSIPTVATGTTIAPGKSTVITIFQTTTIKAIAVKPGCEPSLVASTTLSLVTPTPTLAAGDIKIASYVITFTVPANTSFHITTNGSTPTTSSAKYSGLSDASRSFSLEVRQSITLKAIAVLGSMEPSGVATSTYRVRTALPTGLPASTSATGKLVITLRTPKNVTWYYTTNGNTPNAKSTKVAPDSYKQITLTKSTTLKVVASLPGCELSNPASVSYKIKTAAPAIPKSKTVTGNFTIALKPPADTTWYYTMDGSAPKANSSAMVKAGVTKNLSITKNITLKVLAVKVSCDPSDVAASSFRVRTATPKLPATKTSTSSYKITLTVPAATTWFITLDGKVPTQSSPTRLSAGGKVSLTINRNTIVRVLAISSGCDASAVATATYYVKLSPPKANLAPGTYKGTKTVKLTTSVSGGKIYYSTDPNAPTSKFKAYTKPLTISKTTTLRIYVAKPGYSSSNVAVYKYTIKK